MADIEVVIKIDENLYRKIQSGNYGVSISNTCAYAICNGTPIPDNATNGQVLLQMFPPSVYFGDDEKHIVLLTKDCELTCYNNEWWNAPYERRTDETDN